MMKISASGTPLTGMKSCIIKLLWVALQSQTHLQPQEIQASCGSNVKGQHYNAPHLKQHRSPQVNRKSLSVLLTRHCGNKPSVSLRFSFKELDCD